MLSIKRFGGPLLCLIAWCFFLLFVLSQIDTGRQAFWKSLLRKNVPLRDRDVTANSTPPPDVLAEVERALSTAAGDALRVQHVVKSFNGDRVVDDVSFVVPPSSTFVLLGPNGAGKTTTLDIIREFFLHSFAPLNICQAVIWTRMVGTLLSTIDRSCKTGYLHAIAMVFAHNSLLSTTTLLYMSISTSMVG